MSKKRAKAAMIVEHSADGFWGRVDINNNLITDYAATIDQLKKQMKTAIYEIENIEVEEFEVSYDLTSFFEQFSFLNISDIAKRSSISPNLMRQYAAGIKFPSSERVKQIEIAIRDIGKQLTKIKLHKPSRELVTAVNFILAALAILQGFVILWTT